MKKVIRLTQADKLFLMRESLKRAEEGLRDAVSDCKGLRPMPIEMATRLQAYADECCRLRLELDDYEERNS